MRRDDLRAMIWENQAAMSVGMQQAALNATRPVTDSEALDAIGRKAALKHWLTEPCPDSVFGVDCADLDDEFGEPCQTCEGRGWVPCDGATILHVSLTGDVPPLVGVPLDWLKDER